MRNWLSTSILSIIIIAVFSACAASSPGDDAASPSRTTPTPLPQLNTSLQEVQAVFIAKGYRFEPTKLEEILVFDGENLIESRTNGKFEIGGVQWAQLSLYGPSNNLNSAHLTVEPIVFSDDTVIKPELMTHMELMVDTIARKHWDGAKTWLSLSLEELSNQETNEVEVREAGIRMHLELSHDFSGNVMGVTLSIYGYV